MTKKKATNKTAAKRVIRKRPLLVSGGGERIVRRRVMKVIPVPKPQVDTIVTETDIVTEPKVEVRRAATLSQALTEPAVAVVKPETKVVRRVVKTDRGKRAA